MSRGKMAQTPVALPRDSFALTASGFKTSAPHSGQRPEVLAVRL